MSEVSKSVMSALAIVVSASAVVAGATLRSRNDLGGIGPGVLMAQNGRDYVASKDNGIDVPAADYFYELSDKLKKEYVEPVKDETKLAVGAVRGMVSSLADPKSIYYDKDEFQAFLNARQGKYSGIGVDLALVFDSEHAAKNKPGIPQAGNEDSNETSPEDAIAMGLKIPRVVVTNVVAGGPASKAGVQAGDIVYSVDEHWVVNVPEVAAFRRAQDDFLKKKLTIAKYTDLRNDIRKKTERALMPMKVREKLTLGVAGPVHVVWLRNGSKIDTTIEKAPSTQPGFQVNGSTIRLPLVGDSPDRLKKAIAGAHAVTLDLRHNVNGDFESMRQCLALLAPAGKYGTLATLRKDRQSQLSVTKGNASPPQITLLVDKTTGGAAEILALALSSKGRAKLTGGSMEGDRSVREIIQLPDGSGYTLVTSNYSTDLGNAVVARGEIR